MNPRNSRKNILLAGGALAALFVVMGIYVGMGSTSSYAYMANVFSSIANSASTGNSSISNKAGVKLLFLGDMMFDRGIRAQSSARGFKYIFGEATTTIAAYDLTIANLEGPVTSNISKTIAASGKSAGKAIPGFQFTFPIGTASAIKDAGIDIVSLANNHTYNFGQAGLDETRKQLSASGLQYFGSPSNSSSTTATSTCLSEAGKNNNASKICVGFIGWHEFASASQDDSTVFTSIRALRPIVDYLVIFPHWGIEYEAKPTAKQRAKAQAWIDAGADAVIGAHPHVVETIEQYHGKPIFYSLGNFIFDQYFSFETTNGIGVSIELTKTEQTKTSASYTIIPFSSVGSRVSVPDASSTEKLYQKIKQISDANLTTWLKFR